tara:strand:- start:3957 stop:5126 length:1170 start_codon:yes stop_codon:yes gene_type:complete
LRWIGQHIVDLIARFRSDVYLDDVQTGTIASGGNLGVDSNNKIVKAAEASGDITGVKITTDSGSGSPAEVSSGSANFSLLGTNGVGVTNSGVTMTATAVPGEIDHDSLSNFVANEHIDWTTDQGSTNIHTGNYINTEYSEATTDTAGLMSSAHHDKLDNIETEADVTDTTNVTAAGALMDSECTSLASVKALDQGVATGDSPQFAGINLGHASDTTFARSASGVATIESKIIQTKDKVIHIEQGSLSDNIGTTEHFFPAVTTAESTSFTNVVTPFLMPVGGKLLKVHLKVNQNHNTSSNEITFKLYDLDDGENWNDANKTLLGTKVIDGAAKAAVMVADFQSLDGAGDSGTNVFQAGDLLGISLTNSQNLNITTKYIWSFVFELDFNSY